MAKTEETGECHCRNDAAFRSTAVPVVNRRDHGSRITIEPDLFSVMVGSAMKPVTPKS